MAHHPSQLTFARTRPSFLVCAHAAGAAPVHETVAAVHATALTGELPEWVQLLPAGTFTGLDGRGPYLNPDPEEVVRLTRERMAGSDLPIDYGHALEQDGPAGDAAPAAGWISDLEVREGQVWGRVAWTTAGARSIQGREYRFLSPVFAHPREGDKRVLWLLRAGLTNRPNLVMRSINSRSHQEEGLKELLKRIAAALGLSEEADEATVLARCSSLRSAGDGLTRVAQSVELAATASADEIVTAVQARGTPDPARYVPMEQFTQVSTALHAAQQEKGEAVVDQLIRDGKLAPAQRDWAIGYHTKDPQAFQTFAAGLPVILKPGAEERPANSGGESSHGLDDGALAVCSQLGIKPEDFKTNVTEVTR